MQEAVARATALDSLPRIIRKIPRACFERKARRAYTYLARDLFLVALLSWGIVACQSWIFALALSLLLGTVLTGLFVIGHDAGHRSFSDSNRINDIVGHLAMSPVLWPFHVWRLTHDHHHRWTHHVEHEIAWRPLTTDEYQALTPFRQHAYRLTRSSLFFFASTLFQYFFIRNTARGKYFDRQEAKALRFSLRFTALVAVAYIALAWISAGAYGLLFLFLIPQLVFHFWLSLFTLLHHTSPDNELLAAGEWSPERAQLTMSVQIFYPRLVDWLTHDISWHVPHHVCVGVPHYHLREAHFALKAAYPDLVQEHRLSWSYIRRVIRQCHLIRSQSHGGQGWLAADRYVAAVTSASRS